MPKLPGIPEIPELPEVPELDVPAKAPKEEIEVIPLTLPSEQSMELTSRR